MVDHSFIFFEPTAVCLSWFDISVTILVCRFDRSVSCAERLEVCLRVKVKWLLADLILLHVLKFMHELVK